MIGCWVMVLVDKLNRLAALLNIYLSMLWCLGWDIWVFGLWWDVEINLNGWRILSQIGGYFLKWSILFQMGSIWVTLVTLVTLISC